ncbi:hypothetical protein AYR56_09980 [Loigolactobacillus backii]|uniref:MobA-like NTP transferase domain-containing protein n=1 Tax=Loigolactobacillus backii TaxID=375175 RepID=A0A192H157_9LACO|nr:MULTISPECIES: NTP transferase domain-containing protein [Loigolactobacillus]ANK62539.1 hypothetical protein AYR53_07020 [Loigolactobacillus backii]ANK70450.1 hypothetical protein AYR56_09980 [Loigolactobacillus backii]
MNAIIMAAGLGSRFKEMTTQRHKSLLPINGIPNLERTIKMLQIAGIHEINIVTGYLAKTFDYLVEKYPGVKLIYNDHYRSYNSIYTFSKALPYFGNSYVIDADTVMNKNIFKPLHQSTYITILRQLHGTEWCPVEIEGRVTKMLITAKHIPSMSGISYWSAADAEVIKATYSKYLTEDTLTDATLYWDNIPANILKQLHITTWQVPEFAVYEMDTQEQYRIIQKKLRIVENVKK